MCQDRLIFPFISAVHRDMLDAFSFIIVVQDIPLLPGCTSYTIIHAGCGMKFSH